MSCFVFGPLDHVFVYLSVYVHLSVVLRTLKPTERLSVDLSVCLSGIFVSVILLSSFLIVCPSVSLPACRCARLLVRLCFCGLKTTTQKTRLYSCNCQPQLSRRSVTCDVAYRPLWQRAVVVAYFPGLLILVISGACIKSASSHYVPSAVLELLDQITCVIT